MDNRQIQDLSTSLNGNAAQKIQNSAIKMFYNNYGIEWREMIMNYDNNLDYYCYINGINDPWQDYINYYRE